MKLDIPQTFCQCCGDEITGEVINANPWDVPNGVYYQFCSNECVAHCEEEHQEYLDSYHV